MIKDNQYIPDKHWKTKLNKELPKETHKILDMIFSRAIKQVRIKL